MKNKLFEKIIYVVFAVIVISYVFFKTILEISGSYTVCKITKVKTARGGTSIGYKFVYSGKEYNGNISKPFNIDNEGRYYFVKFWELIPRINMLQTEYSADSCYSKYYNIVLHEIPECN